MARDPQKPRKTNKSELGKDLVDNKYQPEDKAKDDFIESVDKKLDEKLSETSDSIMSEIDKLIAEYQKKVDDYKKPKEEEEKIPEGLDALLKDIKSEVGGDTPKKSGALAVIPKPDKAKEQELIGDENIDPEILKALGLNDVTDLDYGEYSSLLKEKMMANQMGSGGGLDQGKLKDEYKRVRGKTGKFKVKNQKITPSSFVAKTKPSTAVATVTPKLPPAAPQEEVTQVVDPKRQSADKTFALIASKLEIVDKNVQETAAYLTKKDKSEKKEKDAAKKEAQDAATAERENRTENRNIFAAIPGVVGAAVKPIKDALGGFFDGLKRLGFAIFIMELMRFLKDPAKYINDIIDWTNKQIKKLETSVENFVIDKMVKPMNGMIKDLNSKITDFVGIINPLLEKLSLLGISPIDTNSLQVPEIKESDIRNGIAIPQVPNVNDNFLDSIKLDGSDEGDEPEATPSQSTPEATPSQSTPEARPQETLMGQQPSQSGNGLTPQQKAFAETVSYAEGTSGSAGYNTWFGGSQYGGDLSKKTINEVVALQKKFLAEGRGKFDGGRQQSAAVGKYQMTYPETYAKAAGLNPAVDKFTPENQDKLFLYGYIMGQAGVTEAEINAPEMSDQTIDKLAPVFASFPNLFGPDKFGKHGTNTSYYGQGGKSKEQIKEVYKKQREKMPAQAPIPSSVEPLIPPTEEQQQLKSEEQRKRTEELMKGDPRFTPQASVPVITPPVQKASLTTIGGAGSQGTQSPTSAAAGTQSQVVAFSASDSTNLSVMAAKSVYGVVG